MNFSAACSSSPVETPGRIFPARRFIVLTRIVPAAAISSISSGLFFRITALRSSHAFFEPERRDHGADVVVDLGRAPCAIDPPHQPLLVVVLPQRPRLLGGTG